MDKAIWTKTLQQEYEEVEELKPCLEVENHALLVILKWCKIWYPVLTILVAFLPHPTTFQGAPSAYNFCCSKDINGVFRTSPKYFPRFVSPDLIWVRQILEAIFQSKLTSMEWLWVAISVKFFMPPSQNFPGTQSADIVCGGTYIGGVFRTSPQKFSRRLKPRCRQGAWNFGGVFPTKLTSMKSMWAAISVAFFKGSQKFFQAKIQYIWVPMLVAFFRAKLLGTGHHDTGDNKV